MVNFYVNRIQSGIITKIEQIPPLWRERVQAVLNELETQQEMEV